MRKLDISKPSPKDNIPIKIFKQYIPLYSDIITKIFKRIIIDCSFPDNLKYGDLAPIYKKGATTDKTNYRPISLLPVVSKLYERIISDQIYIYIPQ